MELSRSSLNQYAKAQTDPSLINRNKYVFITRPIGAEISQPIDRTVLPLADLSPPPFLKRPYCI